jgi:multicomponent K+:H+ antiporter subunit E
MTRLLPFPLLAAALFLMWLLLNGISVGQVVLGAVVAVGTALLVVPLRPARLGIRRWSAIPKLVGVVTVDVIRSNLAVARVIAAPSQAGHTSGFIEIPLELRHPTALAVLACILTCTPGTAWLEYRSSTGRLLFHVLDLVEEADWIDLIKRRYEPLLMELFP